MRLFLARHGETEWNVYQKIQGATDTELNENGKQQAKRLAAALVNVNLDQIYTSPLKRAAVTAEIVANTLEIPCAVKEGLTEISYGKWEGHTWEEVQRDYEEAYRHWLRNRREARAPQGESYAELADRLVKTVLEIIAEEEKNVLLITHSACIHMLLVELNGTPIENMAKDYPMPNAAAIEFDVEKFAEKFA